MKSKKKLNRRKFLRSAAASSIAFAVVPRKVLGGSGYVAPSDKVTIANIGCGTQGLREMPGMLQNRDVQIVAVCDSNKFTTDYIDWSSNGIVNGIRTTLQDPTWGESIEGIPGGRDIGRDYVEKYYAKNTSSGKYRGCNSYEDFRELLDKEKDLDAVKIMTPDHLHATIAIAAMKKGKHVVTHKPIANRVSEGRLAIETARKTKVITHLLAWRDRPENELTLKWIKDGVIGKLKEIHNWSNRPVWPQWMSNPTDTPPIPKGFNWQLWLGPVPDRPYHPNYTHNVFRGWYDFGGGSIADMGHYSLFPLFQTLGINTAPISAEAYGTTTRTIVDQVCMEVRNDVAFPYSCMVRFRFPKQKILPPFDLFWYDGGIKPFPPEELEKDNKSLPREGMMFVGDKGKILAGFRGENPQIIPEKKMKAYSGPKQIPQQDRQRRSNSWVNSIKTNQESPGSFLLAGPVTETINLAAVALRAGTRVDYDSKNMKITNSQQANKYLIREYRKGWEL
ncbi:MAG: Gfo/Idh/MocA family oxidoreductase [Phycisphaerae bacterium]|nr:Gfo/Idh/MocA family oxidoreductase [Phycisphaerae bacterium]NIU09279.1 Gfo/Idh/MocA family oxidoreductase [Phycisphaerae bacterium]NIU56951.1 Gfo/Idh/MocA family oxidoreductase [Phycisphaerae bacterium]NIW93397.1 Gfo/Idh/MocA family oxidoreductase [Phycisphaerae bacterium]NIW98975.1 Gfo/Idh/MocA family oxidoreductase [Phycisphaerae bacterium]